MDTYHKIQTVYARDPETKFKTLLLGQYAKPEFYYLRNLNWDFTEKVDGTNIRVMLNPKSPMPLRFGGKTAQAVIPSDLVTRLLDRFDVNTLIHYFGTANNVCLYGEGYGPKIQNGGKYRKDQDFVLFDVRIGKWWLERHSVVDIAKKLGIDVVPLIGTGTLLNMIDITGVDLITLVKEVYNSSAPQGMGFMHYQEGPLTESEAQSLVKPGPKERCPVSMDYVKGRACKFTVHQNDGKLYISNRWYDHSQQQLQQLLNKLGIEATVPE